MKKILFLALFLFSPQIFAEDDIVIIPRSEWWANEEYTYLESSYWTDIIKKRNERPASITTPEQRAKAAEIYRQKIEYINQNFAPQYSITETITHEGKEKLAWRIRKSDYVNAIIVHHTDTEYANSQKGIQNIFKFHSLSRQWWDIGYNYIIGYNWEIYQWRKWWDYVVAAHSVWNNISTVWISIMGNYSGKEINDAQYKSLESLIQFLSKKYGIDLNKDYYYNMNCSWAACNVFPMETHIDKTLVWHRDTWHTSCPWDKLEAQIEQIRLDNLEFTAWFMPVKRWEQSPYLNKQVPVTQFPEPKQEFSADIQIIFKYLKWFSDDDLRRLWERVDMALSIETITPKQKELLQKINIVITHKLQSESQ